MTAMLAGPWATMILGDQAADVIKIEAPDRGDHTRAADGDAPPAGFLNLNRSKRSVALDLKTPRGRDVLLTLAATADAVVQNFRPGVVERLGVGYDDVRAVRGDIVYVSISGFGEKGPYADQRVYDPVIQALSGLATVQAGTDDARPRLVRTVLPDKLTAMTAAQAIAAALFARERTRRGAACAPVDARRGDAVPVGFRHGRPDLRRPRAGAAASREPHRPDLRDPRRLHHPGR